MKHLLATIALVALASPSVAEERIHAKPGSYWNYAITDEIKQTKSVTESTLTEVKGDERVIRFVTRGTSNNSISVFDPNWNLLETSAGWK